MKTIIVKITTPPVATKYQEKVLGTHGPMKADEDEIFKYLAGKHQVIEVLEDGSQVELTWDNYNKDNNGSGETPAPEPEPEVPPVPAFVAVTDITDLLIAATVGDAYVLSNAKVKPENATNKVITWYTVVNGTDTKVTSDRIPFTEAGEVVIKMVIKNGKTATEDFVKTITVPVKAPNT